MCIPCPCTPVYHVTLDIMAAPTGIADKKTTTLLGGNFKFRHRPIFPGRFQPSIFGTAELNYCVRDGNRWNLCAKDTGYSVLSVGDFPDDMHYYSTENPFVNTFF